jgi:hypothetical protein
MGLNREHIEVEEEIDGRWIAEAIDVPGALAYGNIPEAAIDSAAALRELILLDRKQHKDRGSLARGD